jgi:hypothetical protein
VSMEIALLTPESPTRFFDEDDPHSTYVFSQDGAGHSQLVIENENGKLSAPASKVGRQK